MPDIATFAGFAIGLAFGVVALLSGFCLLSSLRDWSNGNDTGRIRSYALALAVAIAATQGLAASGLVDTSKSIYQQALFSAPLMLAGGLMFGYGMVLANGCASRALVLFARGNLRSLVVILVIGITAMIALKGLLAPARIAALQLTQTSATSLPALLSLIGLNDMSARLLATAALAGPLLVFAFSGRRSWLQLSAGVAVGLLIAAGWLATGYLGADDFNPKPVTSLSFVSPISDTVQYAMLSTGLSVNFGIAVVAGVLIGSFLTSLLTGGFKLEGYTSANHMVRSISGAALMGVGGALAYGCSIGQGLTGLSTLAIPSFIAVAGILGGAAAGLRGPFVVRALGSPVPG